MSSPFILNTAVSWRPGMVFIGWCACLAVSACSPQTVVTTAPFDARHCMAHVPHDVQGLAILEGPRSKTSIIHDMVPVICNGERLYDKFGPKGRPQAAGSVVFRVVVEYRGEVNAADVIESTNVSDAFLATVAGLIMDTDFVNWAPDHRDTVFVYPARFGD